MNRQYQLLKIKAIESLDILQEIQAIWILMMK